MASKACIPYSMAISCLTNFSVPIQKHLRNLTYFRYLVSVVDDPRALKKPHSPQCCRLETVKETRAPRPCRGNVNTSNTLVHGTRNPTSAQPSTQLNLSGSKHNRGGSSGGDGGGRGGQGPIHQLTPSTTKEDKGGGGAWATWVDASHHHLVHHPNPPRRVTLFHSSV